MDNLILKVWVVLQHFFDPNGDGQFTGEDWLELTQLLVNGAGTPVDLTRYYAAVDEAIEIGIFRPGYYWWTIDEATYLVETRWAYDLDEDNENDFFIGTYEQCKASGHCR